MSKQNGRKTAAAKNEGEGSRTAARRYDAGVRKTVQSGHVESKARDAAKALDETEGNALRRAEAKAKKGPLAKATTG